MSDRAKAVEPGGSAGPVAQVGPVASVGPVTAASVGSAPRSGAGLGRWATRLSRVVLGAAFREVEVQGRGRLPRNVPVLVVANHANGLVDSLLVVHALGYLPRFVAKAGLFKIAPLRPVLRGLGVLPVVRRQDGAAGAAAAPGGSNAEMFWVAHRALADAATVAIFPEGTAHDEPHLLPLRTGAARLALGARAEGAVGLQIVALGLVFDDKLALRSRALAVLGAPLDLDRWVVERGEPTVDDTDRRAVEDLTATIARLLDDVLPTAETVQEAWSLATAADVFAREHDRRRGTGAEGDGPRLSASTAVLRQLSAAPDAARWRVRQAADSYRHALRVTGLRDHDVVSQESSPRLARRASLVVGRNVALAPWAVFGVVTNALPYAVVRAVDRFAPKPAGRGTLRVLAGLVAFPLSWAGVGFLVGRRGQRWLGVAVAAVAAASGYATVVEFERVATLRRSWEGRRRLVGLRRRVDDLLAARHHLLTATEAALHATGADVAEAESDIDQRTR